MSSSTLSSVVFASVVGAIAFLGFALPVMAQVRYAQPSPFDPFFSPYDESYDTHPSFQIYPNAYGAAPEVRVVARCAYPDGWNAGDFNRDVNGTPAGLDHTCPASAVGGRVRSRY